MALFRVAFLASIAVGQGFRMKARKPNSTRAAEDVQFEETEITVPLGADPSTWEVGALQNSTFCRGGSGRTLCAARGDNHLSSGGGGSCKFRYTMHTGSGSNTGVPVVTSGSCTITEADLGRGSHTNQRTRDWVRSLERHDRTLTGNNGDAIDDAGHILANNLGGCGTCPVNIFPQNLRINRGEYRLMEAAIYDCIDEVSGVTGYLSWKFNYKSPALQHLRPDTYTYTATFSGGRCGTMSKTFQNEFWKPSLAGQDEDAPWMEESG